MSRFLVTKSLTGKLIYLSETKNQLHILVSSDQALRIKTDATATSASVSDVTYSVCLLFF